MIRKLRTDLAEKLFGNAEVRSDHVLGNTLLDFGILIAKPNVPFHRRQTQIIDDPFLCSNKGILNNDSKKSFEFRNLNIKLLKVVITDLNQLSIFEALHIQICGSLTDKTPQISRPPVFDSKHHNMLMTVVINIKCLQATGQYKAFVPAYIAVLDHKLAFQIFPEFDF